MQHDRLSFDINTQADVNAIHTVVVPDGDEVASRPIPIKKLSAEFENCMKNEDHMKVVLRVRPLVNPKNENTISVISDTSILTTAPEISKRAQYTKKEERYYTFDKVFGPDSSQEEIFQFSTVPLLQKFIEGEDVMIFAYGMTNAGKTYTIQGNSTNEGVFPRLMNHIFEVMPTMKGPRLNISMLEIYQEKIYDLLGSRRDKLNIRDGNGRVEVVNLSSHPVGSVQEGNRLLQSASEKR
jgi:hypothetical protein